MNITEEDLNNYRTAEITQKELCQKYNTYPKKLKSYFLEVGFKIGEVSNKKRSRALTYNENIFNSVNSLSAYFLGYFLADGSVTFMTSKYKKKPIIRFSCSDNDSKFFYKFIDKYEIKNKVNVGKQYKVKNTDYLSSKMLSVSFSGEKCYNFICKYIDPINKTYKEHNIPTEVIYFDVTLKEALTRNMGRKRKVDEKVIEKQYSQYLNLKSAENAVPAKE